MARYVIDPSRSSVSIHARSNVHPIHTRTQGLEGWLELDLDDLAAAAGHLELAVDKLRSGNPLQDRELRRRIDARKHPTIIGDLTSMETTGDDGLYSVTGDVTFKGVTHAYTEPLTVTFDADGVHLEGSASFDIREFGMQPPRILVLAVEPVVEVSVEIVAEPASSH